MARSESPPRLQHVLIVGAGLAGLTLAIGLRKSAYRVSIIERNAALEEIGAGVQLPANSSRILSHLGALPNIRPHCVQPRDLVIHSYRGSELFTQNLSPSIEQRFGQPHLLVHRADLRRALYDAARGVGTDIRLGANVVDLDLEAATITLESGEVIAADLIVGADGEHSLCRERLLGRTSAPWSSGDVVYRIAIPSVAMDADPELRALKDPPRVQAWYGPNSHAVCYQLREGGIFNIVLTLPEPTGAATIGPQPADLDELRAACQAWDPRFRRLLDVADQALKWTLLETDVLDAWHHPAGRFFLLGDAAHATLPYLAQGAALAFESAYIFALLMAHHPAPSELPSLLAAYSAARIPRAAAIRARSKHMHDICQLRDGPDQRERDRVLREDAPSPGFPNPWADPEWARFMWNFDAATEEARIWQDTLDRSGVGATSAKFERSL